MKIKEISEKVNNIKTRYKKLYTNIIWSNLSEDDDAEIYITEEGIVFVIQEPNRKRGYYAVSDLSILISLLAKVENGVILEHLHKGKTDDMKNCFLDSGFQLYKNYVRTTICYKKNPYKIPEHGRRKLLQEMYDAECGEYPSLNDAQELYDLAKSSFDPLTDDIFTLEKWSEIIQNKECFVYRENGKIVACYVWRLEGKKLYSNMTINQGAANYLYNIERRVFEHMWENGIRIYYSWINCKNQKALKRFNQNTNDYIKTMNRIYNSIYIKEYR